MNKIWVASLVLLGACGMSEEKFQEKSCERAVDCASELGFELTQEDCLTAVKEFTPDGCDYDAKAAAKCWKASSDLACDSTESPSECEDVYVCEETEEGEE